ncbi:MAG: hypothetical protein AB1586_05650 [Pseudomonadota bacterium]
MIEFVATLFWSIDWKAAGGVLFGATISATVSYLLQRNSFAEARRQKAADKRDDRRTLGLNVLTKMMRIASTIELLKQSLDRAFAQAAATGVKSPPWAIVIPLANFPGKVHFEPKELTEIMKLDFDLFNNLGPFDDIHNTLIDVFEMYRSDRGALTSILRADMEGGLGRAEFTAEEMRVLGPKMAALNALIDGMVKRTTEDAKEAWELLQRLQDALNREYDLKLALERKTPTHQM